MQPVALHSSQRSTGSGFRREFTNHNLPLSFELSSLFPMLQGVLCCKRFNAVAGRARATDALTRGLCSVEQLAGSKPDVTTSRYASTGHICMAEKHRFVTSANLEQSTRRQIGVSQLHWHNCCHKSALQSSHARNQIFCMQKARVASVIVLRLVVCARIRTEVHAGFFEYGHGMSERQNKALCASPHDVQVVPAYRCLPVDKYLIDGPNRHQSPAMQVCAANGANSFASWRRPARCSCSQAVYTGPCVLPVLRALQSVAHCLPAAPLRLTYAPAPAFQGLTATRPLVRCTAAHPGPRLM